MTPNRLITSLAEPTDDGRSVVLLIDTNQDVHRLLRARLRTESYDLVGAYSGREGIEKVRAERPAIVLLDLDMPGMDGFAVMRAIKDDPETMGIPVIVLSACNNPHDKVTAFDLGAVDYITKPFDLTELRVRIRSALRIHELMRMLAQRAQIDGLTGLWNRSHFDERWAGEVERSHRHDKPLSLAMMDLDHFKMVNDTFGHPAGDEVLRGVARLLQREGRVCDIACRYGGEEFAIIMPETGPTDAHALCERIRSGLEESTWAHHPNHRVTLSCGVAGADGAFDLTPAAWVEAADRCLYSSKGERNRITLRNLVGPPPLGKAG